MPVSRYTQEFLKNWVTKPLDLAAFWKGLFGGGGGGAVTQLTSKATTVVLSKRQGAITLHNATLNDATNVTFTVTNTLATALDIPIVAHKSGGTLGAYTVHAHSMADGSFKITVRNVSGGNLGEAIVLAYTLLPSSIS